MRFSIIDISHGSEYTSSSEYASVAQGFVENTPSYMFDRVWRIHRVPNMLGLGCTWVLNMARIHTVLCKLYFKDSSQYLECLEFWIC